MSVEACSPLKSLAAQRPFRRIIGHQKEKIAMKLGTKT